MMDGEGLINPSSLHLTHPTVSLHLYTIPPTVGHYDRIKLNQLWMVSEGEG